MTENYNYLLDPVVGDPLEFNNRANKSKPRKWRNKAVAQVANLTGKPLWVRYLGQNGTTLPAIDPSDVTKLNEYRVRTPINYNREVKFYGLAQDDITTGAVAFIDDSDEPAPGTITTDDLAKEISTVAVDPASADYSDAITSYDDTSATIYTTVGKVGTVSLSADTLLCLEVTMPIKANTYVDSDFVLAPIYSAETPSAEMQALWARGVEEAAFADHDKQGITDVSEAATNFYVCSASILRSEETKDGEFFNVTLRAYWLQSKLAAPNYYAFAARHHTGGTPEYTYSVYIEPIKNTEISAASDTVELYLLDSSYIAAIEGTATITPNCYMAEGNWLTVVEPEVDDTKIVVSSKVATVTYPVLVSKDYRMIEAQSFTMSDGVNPDISCSYTDGVYTSDTLADGTYTLTFTYGGEGLDDGTVDTTITIS